MEKLKGEIISDEALCPLLSLRSLEKIGDILAKTGARLLHIGKGRRMWIKLHYFNKSFLIF